MFLSPQSMLRMHQAPSLAKLFDQKNLIDAIQLFQLVYSPIKNHIRLHDWKTALHAADLTLTKVK